MPSGLEIYFPNLKNGKWTIKSPQDSNYNCIAWAACDKTRKWWPNAWTYWPIPRRVNTLGCFMEAFGTLGYKPCDNDRLEIGYQKVAIYADPFDSPKHMARQRFWGTWTSKLGDLEDILHVSLAQVECLGPHPIADYGCAVRFMKRDLWTAFRIMLQQWAERLKGRIQSA